ncbi:MAG: MoaD/ThiS family protein [Isosphaeraceae bacterium]
MPVVFIPAPLRGLTGGAAEVAVEGLTVAEALDALDQRYPGLKDRVCRGETLAPGLQVAVDQTMTRQGLRAPLRPESEVHILPAIGGG